MSFTKSKEALQRKVFFYEKVILVQGENYKYWLGGFAEGEGALVISVVKNDKVARGIVLQP